MEMQLIRLLGRQVCTLLIAIMWQKSYLSNKRNYSSIPPPCHIALIENRTRAYIGDPHCIKHLGGHWGDCSGHGLGPGDPKDKNPNFA